ncbi:hypothetical protein BDV96DRAFT_593857 [Lophiotrema nucula]|uniref:Uncharacterized protein n=1 Tax=Lophiotrema nucula TaxID=690887 RepID=A0A6A5ZUL1_9PLEO|nr:hypothetical protein BDV96DRAFT_593857 [Lophiotrema nucula]
MYVWFAQPHSSLRRTMSFGAVATSAPYQRPFAPYLLERMHTSHDQLSAPAIIRQTTCSACTPYAFHTGFTYARDNRYSEQGPGSETPGSQSPPQPKTHRSPSYTHRRIPNSEYPLLLGFLLEQSVLCESRPTQATDSETCSVVAWLFLAKSLQDRIKPRCIVPMWSFATPKLPPEARRRHPQPRHDVERRWQLFRWRAEAVFVWLQRQRQELRGVREGLDSGETGYGTPATERQSATKVDIGSGPRALGLADTRRASPASQSLPLRAVKISPCKQCRSSQPLFNCLWENREIQG